MKYQEIETEPQVRFITVPATLPRIRVVAYRVNECRTVIFLHGEVISCTIRSEERTPLLNL